MIREKDRPEDLTDALAISRQAIRKRAEEIFQEKTAQSPKNIEAHTPDELQKVLHELRVHQIELEMQNDELRRMQMELDTLLSRYFDLYDLAPVGYVTLSEQGLILEANLAAAALLGMVRGEMIKQSIHQFILKEDQDLYYLHRKQLLETDEPQSHELRMVKKDETVFWTHLEVTVVQNAEGTPLYLAIISDITERKKSERERERLVRLLGSKNEELQSIIYISSHDLKSPLVNITGFCDMLVRYCDQLKPLLDNEHADKAAVRNAIQPLLETKIPEALRFIALGTQKMKSLIDGMLHVSRIGTTVLRLNPLDMNALIGNIIKNAAYKTQEIGAEVTTNNLPACVADAEQINQVFSNLLDNALKYADPSRKPRVHISGYHQDGQSIYCVRDNGLGIHPDHQKKVFELFHRLNPQSGIEGEGMGLTIVRRILDMHNGKVWIESVPGEGTQFFVSLSNKEEV
jgi:PAS domain S-box-containing protein